MLNAKRRIGLFSLSADAKDKQYPSGLKRLERVNQELLFNAENY